MAANYACKAKNPLNPEGELIDVIFPGDMTLRWYKTSPVRYWNLIAAKFVLENTQRVFRGLREFSTGGWCYTGTPEKWHIRMDVIVPFPKDKVYAVYVNPRMRVFECRAEFVADDDNMNPKDWRNRYGGLIWKSIF